MTAKEYFILGCKLFGVYCLVLAISGVLSVFLGVIEIVRGYQDMSRLSAMVIPVLLIGQCFPLIYMVSGIYLLTSGEAFYKFAYPGENKGVVPGDKFLLYLKMLGIFLVLKYVPDFIKFISQLVFIVISPPYITLGEATRSGLSNFVVSLWGIMFGLYLVRDGQWVAKMALKSTKLGEV